MNNRENGADTLLVMGQITGVHGLDGNVKVRSFAQSLDLFTPGSRVFLHIETCENARPFDIQRCVPHKKGLLMHLAGVDDRDAAEALIGKELLVHRSRLPEPEDNAWYWQDLYGLTVTDQTLGDLGIIDTVFSTGAHDILVVKDRETERLIPMHRQFVLSVDLDKAVMITRLPEGYE
ncbi:MAG: ribosome maturation factor RimM [Desulfotignum sp.]